MIEKQKGIPNTLAIILKALIGGPMTIELKNDSVINGILESVELNMNCTVKDATETKSTSVKSRGDMHIDTGGDESGSTTILDSMLVKGNTIRMVIPPVNFKPRPEVAAFVSREGNRTKKPLIYD